eukprot:TRINITY_DN10265_c0_g1_i2.p2 TRINITY_DN10265_c0_g1~~TRINITY_DN10265_c0_g1_i2.p2  ORF type:complete len:142 (-),score=19.91 TRINITY_DN10265_c0_g1_i2:116-541(-)
MTVVFFVSFICAWGYSIIVCARLIFRRVRKQMKGPDGDTLDTTAPIGREEAVRLANTKPRFLIAHLLIFTICWFPVVLEVGIGWGAGPSTAVHQIAHSCLLDGTLNAIAFGLTKDVRRYVLLRLGVWKLEREALLFQGSVN